MKRIIYLLSIVLALTSCKKENEFSYDKKLLNCYTEYMNYLDNYLFYNIPVLFPPHEPFTQKINFRYNDERIVEITGGLTAPLFYGQLVFSNEIYDSIIYENNSIKVFIKPEGVYSAFENPKSPIIYELDSNKSLKKVVTRDSVQHFFVYENDIIHEKNKDGELLRKFYFENNNLIKVEKEILNSEGTVIYKKEILLENYDNKHNPLKNNYFILGTFYRAFSENNFREITIYEYELKNGEMVIRSHSWQTIPIEYNEQGYPLL
jgi:hypothetical protein